MGGRSWGPGSSRTQQTHLPDRQRRAGHRPRRGTCPGEICGHPGQRESPLPGEPQRPAGLCPGQRSDRDLSRRLRPPQEHRGAGPHLPSPDAEKYAVLCRPPGGGPGGRTSTFRSWRRRTSGSSPGSWLGRRAWRRPPSLSSANGRRSPFFRRLRLWGDDAKLGRGPYHGYGGKLYINGDLTVNEESAPWLEQVSYLRIHGDARVTRGDCTMRSSLSARDYDRGGDCGGGS